VRIDGPPQMGPLPVLEPAGYATYPRPPADRTIRDGQAMPPVFRERPGELPSRLAVATRGDGDR
jgi:hypothetical protein